MNNEDKDHIDELLDEIEQEESTAGDKLTEEIESLKHKLLKQAADNDNFRKRMVKETDEKIKYANQSLVSKFLPVLDNFDLALQHTEEDKQTIIEGIRLNRNVMLDAMGKVGINKIDTNIGDMFNPDIHEAVSICCNPEMENNVVTVVIQGGYKMHERVIRPAKVQVNKKDN